MDNQAIDILLSRFVLFSVEGTSEGTVIQVLYDNDLMIVPRERVVKDALIVDRPYTRKRKAAEIANDYFSMNYETAGAEGLAVARIVDSSAPKFEFPKRRQNGTKVLSFVTRPEIEMLAIHAEGAYRDWVNATRRDRQLKPNEFCKQCLGLGKIKEKGFLEEYWGNGARLIKAIKAHAETSKRKNGELLLVDLLK